MSTQKVLREGAELERDTYKAAFDKANAGRHDLALLIVRLIRRMRAARTGKGMASGDDALERQAIGYLRRKGLMSPLRADCEEAAHDEGRCGITDSPPGMLQDDSRELSKALASKPDAMPHARKAAQAIGAFGEEWHAQKAKYELKAGVGINAGMPDALCGKAISQAAGNGAAQLPEPVRPDLLERLTYHALERDDLTIDEVLSALSSGWKLVRGRSERALLLQLCSLLAGSYHTDQLRGRSQGLREGAGRAD